MSRIVKAGLIQTSLAASTDESLETIRNAQVERTLKYIDQAGQEGVQILCMQEIFYGPTSAPSRTRAGTTRSSGSPTARRRS